jgi:hypothetical protein
MPSCFALSRARALTELAVKNVTFVAQATAVYQRAVEGPPAESERHGS